MSHSPSTAFSEVYKYLKGAAQSIDKPVKSLLISGIVYGAKEVFKGKFFVCPLKDHSTYGYMIIFGPAVVLFCISLLVCRKFWHLTFRIHHCCRKDGPGKSRAIAYLALLSPLMWLIFAFADDLFYTCAKIGPAQMLRKIAGSTDAKEALEIQISDAQAESQIIAWGILLSIIFLVTVAITFERCILSGHDTKMYSKKELEDLETCHAVDIFNEKMEALVSNQAKQKIDDLIESLKKESDALGLGKEKLAEMYPNIKGEEKLEGEAMKLETTKKAEKTDGDEDVEIIGKEPARNT